jgi:ketosteroid isomerase-like protein
MTGENMKIVRAGVDAVNRRDPDAFVACVHPDVVWEVGIGVLDLQGIYRGRAGVREWFEKSFEVWEMFHVEVEEIAQASDGQVFLGIYATARGRGGVETTARAWQVCSFADGKIMTRRVFLDRDEALEAAGLSE